MPARVMRQNKEIKELFRQRIQEKIAREKEAMQKRIDEELPSWISWAIKPLAGYAFDSKRRRDSDKGEGGEGQASLNFWLFLSKEWILVNDVVLEPEPEEFIQIDHVLIGPPGIFLVETKAWEGAFLGFKDHWKRKEGNKWVRCESPTKQNLRHLRLFKKWLYENFNYLSPDMEETIYPVVLFTRAKWLKANECSMPVFNSPIALAWHIRRQGKIFVYPPALVERVAEKIVNALPCHAVENPPSELDLPRNDPVETDKQQASGCKADVKTGRTKNGRPYVKVTGSKEDAEKVRKEYEEKGYNTGTVQKDRYTKGTWFFYLE